MVAILLVYQRVRNWFADVDVEQMYQRYTKVYGITGKWVVCWIAFSGNQQRNIISQVFCEGNHRWPESLSASNAESVMPTSWLKQTAVHYTIMWWCNVLTLEQNLYQNKTISLSEYEHDRN